MSGYESEPIRGLPGHLPPGETILWQGAPDWRRLALTACHARGVALYFGALVLWAVASGAGMTGIGLTLGAAAVALGLLVLFAWGVARTTVYTLTNRRIVLRMGIALPKCINVPLGIVTTAALQQHGDGTGDLALAITRPERGGARMGYAMLWPHARPWRLGKPEPMLRSVPQGAKVAALLARALAEVSPEGRRLPIAEAPAQEAAPIGGAVAA